MLNSRRTKLFLLSLLGLALLLSPNVYAINFNGVALGPSIVDRIVKPGESFEQIFEIRNQSDETVTIEPYVQDYRIENDQWNAVENPDKSWSPMTWATIISAPAELGSGEQGQVRVRFDVPAFAEAGEHLTFFTVKFVPAAQEAEEQSAQVTLASQVRSLIYVKVTDALGRLNLQPAWRLDKAGTKFLHFGDPEFIVAAANTGNVHLEVRGSIEFTDLLRNQATKLDIPRFNILPGAEKEFRILWDEAPFIGYFQGKIQVTYDGENFEERSIRFVIVPLLTLLGTVAIITAIILTVALYIRSLRKRLAEAERLQNNNPSERR